MAAAWYVIFNEENRNERNNFRIVRKFLHDTQNPFDIPERRFQEIYRLSRETVMQLCMELHPYMPQGIKSTAIPSELKVSDLNGKILAVNSGHGGRTHDARLECFPYFDTFRTVVSKWTNKYLVIRRFRISPTTLLDDTKIKAIRRITFCSLY
ncbi:hypothetical protein CAJAP_03310 [Camponotus japonicus]